MNKKALLAIAIAVFIPLIGYLLVKSASDKAIALPRHYFPDTVINKIENGKSVDDTVWHKVANFHLINQLGDITVWPNCIAIKRDDKKLAHTFRRAHRRN